MSSLRGEGWTASIVVEIDGQKGGLVAKVEKTRGMEVIEARDEGFGPAEEGDESGDGVGNEARIKDD